MDDENTRWRDRAIASYTATFEQLGYRITPRWTEAMIRDFDPMTRTFWQTLTIPEVAHRCGYLEKKT